MKRRADRIDRITRMRSGVSRTFSESCKSCPILSTPLHSAEVSPLRVSVPPCELPRTDARGARDRERRREVKRMSENVSAPVGIRPPVVVKRKQAVAVNTVAADAVELVSSKSYRSWISGLKKRYRATQIMAATWNDSLMSA